MEIPNFTPDVNEAEALSAPEAALPKDFLETTIPLEGTETPQVPQEKHRTGWRRESEDWHKREKKLLNGSSSNNKGSEHIHHWDLGDNLREISIGHCAGCGKEKEFKNHIEDILGYVPHV